MECNEYCVFYCCCCCCLLVFLGQDALPNGAGDATADKMRRLDQEAKTLTSQLEVASKQV